MNRKILLTLVLVALIWTPVLEAADTTAQARAARRELEEFVQRTNTRLRDMEEAQIGLLTRISQLEDENRKLRGEILKVSRNNNTDELDAQLKRLSQDIKKVDDTRVADFKKLQGEITDVLQTVQKDLNARQRVVERNDPPPSTNKLDDSKFEYLKYQIQSGDNVYRVIKNFKQDHNIDLKVQDILDANPGVDWRRLKIGQTILVPKRK